MSQFNKPPLTAAQHIEQWRERGLAIADPAEAEHYLGVIGYYRLSAYTLPFQVGNPDHRFREGATFQRVIELYNFDRALRLLVLDAIERIEVAIRARLSDHMSLNYGTHWYLDANHFTRGYNHAGLLDCIEHECRISKETFVQHYRNKYSEPALPPSWMVTEMLTYGQLSKVYDNLAAFKDQKAIARPFGTTAELLRSWMQSISYLRNVCAHHMRLWNRELGNAPKVPKHPKANWIKQPIVLADPAVDPNKRLYLALAVIESLLQAINPESTWHQRLHQLMQAHPRVSKAHMGMPEDWASDPFWRLAGQQPEVHG